MQDLGGRQDDHAENDLEEAKEVVDKVQPPGIVRFSLSFLGFFGRLLHVVSIRQHTSAYVSIPSVSFLVFLGRLLHVVC